MEGLLPGTFKPCSEADNHPVRDDTEDWKAIQAKQKRENDTWLKEIVERERITDVTITSDQLCVALGLSPGGGAFYHFIKIHDLQPRQRCIYGKFLFTREEAEKVIQKRKELGLL